MLRRNGHTGHRHNITNENMICTLSFVVQVLLTATRSSTMPDHLQENHLVYHGLCVNLDHVSAIPSAETTTKLPDLDSNMYGIGQPGTAPAGSLGACLQKPTSQRGQLANWPCWEGLRVNIRNGLASWFRLRCHAPGHGIAGGTMMLTLFFVVQVGYTSSTVCYRSNNRLIALSCPCDVCDCRRQLFVFLAQSASTV